MLDAARAAPICLILEDLHDYDTCSLDAARVLLQQLEGEKLLVLGTCRTAEALSAGEALAGVIERFEHTLVVPGLALRELGELMTERLQTQVPFSLLQQVHQRSDGNPLYVQAIVSVLGCASQSLHDNIDLGRLRLPESLALAGRRQLDCVTPACRRLLQRAAVLGREFELSVLTRLGELEDTDLLDQACRYGVLMRDPTQSRRYRFAHALLHELLADELSPADLANTHALAAQALLADHSTSAPRQWYRIASHLLTAGGCRNLERAARIADRSGRIARSRGADAQSADAFGLAVSATRKSIEASQAQSAERIRLRRALAGRLTDLATAFWLCGQHKLALTHLAEVGELGHSLGDPRLLVDAALGTLDNCNARLSQEQVALCEQAFPVLEHVPNAQRVRLLAQFAGELAISNERERGLALLEQAERLARDGCDGKAELALAHSRVIAFDDCAPLTARRVLIDDYAALAMRHQDRRAVAWAEGFALYCAIEAADPVASSRVCSANIRS